MAETTNATTTTDTLATIASVLGVVSTATTILDRVSDLMPEIEAAWDAIWGIFTDATPNLSNAERIALLRAKGVAISTKAEAWLAAHPDTTT